MDINILAPLNFKYFRQRLFASLCKNCIAAILQVSFAWQLIDLSASKSQIIYLQIALTLPIAIFTIPAGILADIYNQKKILLFSYGWLILLMTSLVISTFLNFLTPWLLLILISFYSLGNAIAGPAWHASLAKLIPSEYIKSAVSLQQISFSLSSIFGALLGGVFITKLGHSFCLLLCTTGLIYIFYTVFVWSENQLMSTKIKFFQINFKKIMNYFKINFKIFSKTRISLLVTFLLLGVPGSLYSALMPIIAMEYKNSEAFTLAYLLSMFSLGCTVGSTVIGGLKNKINLFFIIPINSIGLTFSTLLLNYITHKETSIAMSGFFWMASVVSINTLLQQTSDDKFRGRIMSAFIFTAFFATTIGSFIWSKLINILSLSEIIFLNSIILAFSSAIIIFLSHKNYFKNNIY